jgi:hypothetical protein
VEIPKDDEDNPKPVQFYSPNTEETEDECARPNTQTEVVIKVYLPKSEEEN